MENKTVVKLVTTYYQSKRLTSDRFTIKKELVILKKQCSGYNFLTEDCQSMGIEECLSRIENINDCADGVYKIIVCNESRDWQTNIVDDYDYRLVPL